MRRALAHGLTESDNTGATRAFHGDGVYSADSYDHAMWYAVPQCVFGDGRFHQIMLRLRIRSCHTTAHSGQWGTEYITKSPEGGSVYIEGVVIRLDVQVPTGNHVRRMYERCDAIPSWDPELEA